MKAVTWQGRHHVEVSNVDAPTVVNDRDIVVEVTSTAICGSDLHLYDGFIPTMQKGDILGHEFMGRVVEKGKEVHHLQIGDRVVVPFNIACGKCYYCEQKLTSLCDNSNPNAAMAEKLYGQSGAGLFGYSHLYGGYSGGQAEYVRVPFADVGPLKIPDDMEDEQVLFLSDVLPTGYMAAENCQIREGDVVAVWGCGPVGQFAIKSALLLGARQVIAIDRIPFRLELAAKDERVIALHSDKVELQEALRELTGGRGPDACIDAVGMEAHGTSLGALYDQAKTAAYLATDRPQVLREAILACRKGGTLSIPGVYGGFVDKLPMGAAFAKGLTFRMGQTHVHRYMGRLLELIREGKIDPRFIITHRASLEKAPELYETFRTKADHCLKVVMHP